MFHEIVLTCRCMPGAGIDEVAKELIGLANKLDMKVEVRFNGITLLAFPNDSAEEMARQYFKSNAHNHGLATGH